MTATPSKLLVHSIQLDKKPEPWTKEKWRAYVFDPRRTPPPVPETLSAYLELPDDVRLKLSAQRVRYHDGLPLIRTPYVDALFARMDGVLMRNIDPQAGSHPGLVVDGPAFAGKSTAVKMYARELERALRTERPELFVDDGQGRDDTTPVVYITLTAATTPKMLSQALGNFFALPQSRRKSLNTADVTDAVLAALERDRTALVIVDEIHFLDCSQKEGRLANDHLKHLMNSSGATFVYAGVDVEAKGLFSEGGAPGRTTQTAARFHQFKLPYFPYKTDEDKRVWARTIHSFESMFALYRHERGTLATYADYLYARTQGRLGSLSDFLRAAAKEAIETGHERVGMELLGNMATDQATQAAYEANARRRSRARQRQAAPASSETA